MMRRCSESMISNVWTVTRYKGLCDCVLVELVSTVINCSSYAQEKCLLIGTITRCNNYLARITSHFCIQHLEISKSVSGSQDGKRWCFLLLILHVKTFQIFQHQVICRWPKISLRNESQLGNYHRCWQGRKHIEF